MEEMNGNENSRITPKKLDNELLFAQVLGILAVVNGHYGFFNSSMYQLFLRDTWEMVFFIFLSGVLFGRSLNRRSCGAFVLHKCKTLLLPALFVNFCYGIISFFMRRYHLAFYGEDLSFRTLFIEPFGANYQFGNNVALWFFFQLFIIEMIANLLYRLPHKRKKLFDAAVLAVSFLLSVFCAQTARENAFYAVRYLTLLRTGFLFVFFTAGIVYEKYLKKKLQEISAPGLVSCAAIGCQIILIYLFPVQINNVRSMDMSALKWILIPYFVFLFSSAFILSLARFLSPVLGKSKLLPFIGPNIRYIVYHHQFCGILFGFIPLFFQAMWGKRFFPAFSPWDFQRSRWYSFSLAENNFGKIIYFLIPFFIPVITGVLINKLRNKKLRFVIWCLLTLAACAFIAVFGRYFQDFLRNTETFY